MIVEVMMVIMVTEMLGGAPGATLGQEGGGEGGVRREGECQEGRVRSGGKGGRVGRGEGAKAAHAHVHALRHTLSRREGRVR